MNKKKKIVAGIVLIVVGLFTPIFIETTNNNEMIKEWENLNMSLSHTTWELDESIQEYSFKEFIIPETNGFKSYMPYNFFSTSSKQYDLQQYAYTDKNGLRKIDDRYVIAVGTYYFDDMSTSIGTYIDLVLENGEIIPCVVGDIKADIHTDSNNIITLQNNCVSEFIVSLDDLHSVAKQVGDVSYIEETWMSPVDKIIVYERNIFDE